MKRMILSLLLSACAWGAEAQKDKPILVEDPASPVKQAGADGGSHREIRLFGYDDDRIRIIVTRDLGADQKVRSTTYAIVVDHENECYTASVLNGEITGSGDQDISCRRIRDNTRFYPYLYDAYLIYSKKHGFVFPIVDHASMFGDYPNDMVRYFAAKYLK